MKTWLLTLAMIRGKYIITIDVFLVCHSLGHGYRLAYIFAYISRLLLFTKSTISFLTFWYIIITVFALNIVFVNLKNMIVSYCRLSDYFPVCPFFYHFPYLSMSYGQSVLQKSCFYHSLCPLVLPSVNSSFRRYVANA